jgi:hypothetical protein
VQWKGVILCDGRVETFESCTEEEAVACV